jgi:two-component system response regulator NreC
MSSGSHRPRVLLADDDLGVQIATARLLSLSFDVVACVDDTAALFDAVVQLQPDVVVLDFSMPGGVGGLEACRRLKTLLPRMHVVAFTAHDDPDLRAAAYEAGASGFVWKLEGGTDLVAAIHSVVSAGG